MYLIKNINIVLIIVMFLPLIGFYNVNYFETALGYFGIYHIVMQLYGFLVISNKKINEKLDSILTRICFWLIVCSALLHWFQGYSTVGLNYFFINKLILFPSIVSSAVLFKVMMVSVILYMAYSFKKLFFDKVINLGQIYVMLASWIIFYFGLVLSKSNNLFYLLSLTFHGINYLVHVIYSKKKLNNEVIVKDYKNVQFTIIASLIWSISLLIWGTNPYIIPIVYIPLYLHFVFDSFFWKKNRVAKL
jgi:hypothetical protein